MARRVARISACDGDTQLNIEIAVTNNAVMTRDEQRRILHDVTNRVVMVLPGVTHTDFNAVNTKVDAR